MERTKMYGREGFTLIEIVLSMAIVGIVLAMSYPILMFGRNVFGVNNRQYEVQADVRQAIDYINKQVRYATNIELLDTVPTMADTDEYDYIYINGDGDIIHSKYNGGGARGSKLVINDIVSGQSCFSSIADGTTIGVKIKSARTGITGGTQTYDIPTEIELPNVNINKKYFAADNPDAKVIKYRINLVIPTITAGTPVTPEDPPPDPGVNVNVKVIIEAQNGSARYFMLVFDGVTKTLVKSGKKYTAECGTFASGSFHSISALEAPTDGGTYTEFYNTSSFEIGTVDMAKTIPAPVP